MLQFFIPAILFCSRDDKIRSWKAVRARTQQYATFQMEMLFTANPEYATWILNALPQCGTYAILARGCWRRGLVSSNPNEQFNSMMLPERNLAVCDVITEIVGRMSSIRYNFHRKATQRLKDKHLLVPRAELDHKEVIRKSATYQVWHLDRTEEELHASVKPEQGATLFFRNT